MVLLPVPPLVVIEVIPVFPVKLNKLSGPVVFTITLTLPAFALLKVQVVVWPAVTVNWFGVPLVQVTP